jgi:hypothetical protein
MAASDLPRPQQVENLGSAEKKKENDSIDNTTA